MKTHQILLWILIFSSCTHKNSKDETSKYSDHFVKDSFGYNGSYVWAFDLMGGEQISNHIFYEDSIAYTMTGKVYSTDYTMKKLSYEKAKNKWIGEDETGTIYVLFFKDKTDSSLTVYKHKCKSSGLEEAINFDVPKPDATDDHGWNVYSLDGDDAKDVLPISGNFINEYKEIFISDSVFIFDQKKVQKMSFHLGERRWVGKYQDHYLQVFFKNFVDKKFVQLSATWSKDLEQLYNSKYNSTTDWDSYAKQ